MSKFKVAFLCVENSCRSQMAEAISKHLAADTYEAYSAGDNIAEQIKPEAVQVIKELYGIDMTEKQYPKHVNDLPEMDIVVRMGCGIECPHKYNRYSEDWDIEDPSGKPIAEFKKTAKLIEEKIIQFRDKIKNA